jgi:hypothetical protein
MTRLFSGLAAFALLLGVGSFAHAQYPPSTQITNFGNNNINIVVNVNVQAPQIPPIPPFPSQMGQFPLPGSGSPCGGVPTSVGHHPTAGPQFPSAGVVPAALTGRIPHGPGRPGVSVPPLVVRPVSALRGIYRRAGMRMLGS